MYFMVLHIICTKFPSSYSSAKSVLASMGTIQWNLVRCIVFEYFNSGNSSGLVLEVENLKFPASDWSVVKNPRQWLVETENPLCPIIWFVDNVAKLARLGPNKHREVPCICHYWFWLICFFRVLGIDGLKIGTNGKSGSFLNDQLKDWK